MSCQLYPIWTNEDGDTFPAGYYESEDGSGCNPDGSSISPELAHTLDNIFNNSPHSPKSWFDKTFLTNGKLNSTAIGVLIAIGAGIVLSRSRR